MRVSDDLKSALQSMPFVSLPPGSPRSGCEVRCADMKVAKS